MKQTKHGGDIYSFAKETGCKSDKIIDFSSNINPLKPKIKLNLSNIKLSRYADNRYSDLKEILGRKYETMSENIALYNGGSSAIFWLFETLGIKKCTLYAPLYGEYKRAASKYSSKIKLINRLSSPYQKPLKNSLAVFVNPSTPDGKYYDLKRLLKIWKKQNCTVVIDESFLEFADKPSALKYLKKYKKLYILKSLTKFYACAGVRVGIVISLEKNIKRLDENMPCWNISTFDVEFIKKALKDKRHKKLSLEKNRKNRKMLKKILKKSKYIKKVYPSNANFLLTRLKNIDASKLQERLKKQKILIRSCENFDFLNDSFVRFAVKDKKDQKKLKKALFA